MPSSPASSLRICSTTSGSSFRIAERGGRLRFPPLAVLALAPRLGGGVQRPGACGDRSLPGDLRDASPPARARRRLRLARAWSDPVSPTARRPLAMGAAPVVALFGAVDWLTWGALFILYLRYMDFNLGVGGGFELRPGALELVSHLPRRPLVSRCAAAGRPRSCGARAASMADMGGLRGHRDRRPFAHPSQGIPLHLSGHGGPRHRRRAGFSRLLANGPVLAMGASRRRCRRPLGWRSLQALTALASNER